MRILAVDVGTSRTHAALLKGPDVICRIELDTAACLDERGAASAAEVLLARAPEGGEGMLGGLASVVPRATGSWLQVLEKRTGRAPVVVDAAGSLPVKVGLRMPERVGADRVADVVAAVERHEPPVLAVDLGTAATFDLVETGPLWVGGVIAPGPEAAMEGLTARAVQVDRVTMDVPTCVAGRDTEEALRSGVVLGHAALVDGLVRRIWDERGGRCPVIATGGWAARLQDLLETVDEVDPDLTLRGVALIALHRT